MQVMPSEGSMLCVFPSIQVTFSDLNVADVWDLLLFGKFCVELTEEKMVFC